LSICRHIYRVQQHNFTVDANMSLSSVFAVHSPIDCELASGPSALSLNALDHPLMSKSCFVDSKNLLLPILSTLRHSSVVLHVRSAFMRASQWFFVVKTPLFSLTESVWLVIAGWLAHSSHPLTPQMDSLIVYDIPPFFDQFRRKHVDRLCQESRDGLTTRQFRPFECDKTVNVSLWSV
jgi:hypothetical protein